MIESIKVGEVIPSLDFLIREGAYDKIKNTHEEFRNKRVLILSIPGPFLVEYPSKMVHGYSESKATLESLGVNEVYFTSNCDYFTLRAWQKQEDLHNIKIFPDGNSSWAGSVGFLMNQSERFMGPRSHRYAMIVDDLKMKKVFYEDITADPQNCFIVTNVENIIKYLESIRETWEGFK